MNFLVDVETTIFTRRERVELRYSRLYCIISEEKLEEVFSRFRASLTG